MTALQSWMTANAKRDGEVAEKVGLSRVQVLRIRRGRYRPSRESALKLEAFTGIPAGVFLLEDTSVESAA